MKHRIEIDLLSVCVISSLLVPCIIFSAWLPLRIILGLPFILLFPGYGLLAALFPAKNSLTVVERLTYSLALSVALTGLIGLILNYIWKIDLYPMLITLTSVIIITSCVAWYRRRRLPFIDHPVFSLRFRWKQLHGIDVALVSILSLAIIGAVVVSVHAAVANRQGYTELYLLGSDGKAADYPRSLKVGEPGKVTLVLANREKADVSYSIEAIAEGSRIWFDGIEKSSIDIFLNNKQEYSFEVKFTFDNTGDAQKLDFLLFKNGIAEKYLEVYLKIDVSP